jgi:hypothetical protein
MNQYILVLNPPSSQIRREEESCTLTLASSEGIGGYHWKVANGQWLIGMGDAVHISSLFVPSGNSD